MREVSHVATGLVAVDPELIVTPRVETWLAGHDELALSDERDVELLRRLLGPRQGLTPGVFRGSLAGQCARRQVLGFLNADAKPNSDPVLQNLFVDGTWRHARWQLLLSKCIPGVELEVGVRADEIRLGGSIDAVQIDERWGFEFKGISSLPPADAARLPFDAHLLQAGRYWLATDHDPRFPLPLTRWVFVYEDKQTQEWREVVVTRSLAIDALVADELRRLNETIDNEQLPDVQPECEARSGSQFETCPFSSHCTKPDTC